MPKIVICDDEPERLQEWVRALEQLDSVSREFGLLGVSGDDLQEVIARLEKRRVAARSGDDMGELDSVVDTAAVFVVDYDLVGLAESTYQTGEGIAYLARCFSTCGLIIELNQFGENVFDLTLRGHPDSFADLNLDGSQLGNAGLWTSRFESFRPWAWPLVPRALPAFERRVRDVEKNLDKTILEYLGFFIGRSVGLPRSISRFLGGQQDPSEVTFRSFVSESGQGLRSRDKQAHLTDTAIARIAAARIGRWLERLVLPGQDVLVDAPHLALRFPSLLAGPSDEVEAWNATAESVVSDTTALKDDRIESHRFELRHWISRPAWWWQSVMNDDTIDEVRDPWNVQPPDLVFCEDTSRFVPTARAKEFVAELESPFVRRFVEGPEGDDQRRRVSYEPTVAFTL